MVSREYAFTKQASECGRSMQKKWIFRRTPPMVATAITEIDLGMTRPVRRRHEGLSPARACDPDLVLHHRVASP